MKSSRASAGSFEANSAIKLSIVATLCLGQETREYVFGQVERH